MMRIEKIVGGEQADRMSLVCLTARRRVNSPKPTPRVEFKISFKLSSSSNANESSGITTVFPPKFSQHHRIPNKTHVVSNRGLDIYQGSLLLLAAANVALRGDIIPKVSMEMRRISAQTRTGKDCTLVVARGRC